MANRSDVAKVSVASQTSAANPPIGDGVLTALIIGDSTFGKASLLGGHKSTNAHGSGIIHAAARFEEFSREK